jgi:hypothetical protein
MRKYYISYCLDTNYKCCCIIIIIHKLKLFVRKDISFRKTDFSIILNNIIKHEFQSQFYGLRSNNG